METRYLIYYLSTQGWVSVIISYNVELIAEDYRDRINKSYGAGNKGYAKDLEKELEEFLKNPLIYFKRENLAIFSEVYSLLEINP